MAGAERSHTVIDPHKVDRIALRRRRLVETIIAIADTTTDPIEAAVRTRLERRLAAAGTPR